MRRLVAIDPAGTGKESVSGIAWWLGDELAACARLRHVGDLWALEFHRHGWDAAGPSVWFATDWLAWRAIVRGWPGWVGGVPGCGLPFDCGYVPLVVPGARPLVRGVRGPSSAFAPTALVMEQGHGAAARSVDMLAWRRGFIAALAMEAGCPTIAEMNNATWAGHVGRHFGTKFPRDSAGRKAKAAELAGRLIGPPLVKSWDDMYDAILVGLAAVKLGIGWEAVA